MLSLHALAKAEIQALKEESLSESQSHGFLVANFFVDDPVIGLHYSQIRHPATKFDSGLVLYNGRPGHKTDPTDTL